MKRSLLVFFAFVLMLVQCSANGEAAPTPPTNENESSSIYDGARKLGEELGKELFQRLLKQGSENPYKFLDMFDWGMSKEEVIAAASAGGMMRAEQAEHKYSDLENDGYYYLVFFGYPFYGWPGAVNYYFVMHPRKGLYEVEVLLFYPEDMRTTYTYDNFKSMYKEFKLNVVYDHGVPTMEFDEKNNVSAFWLLDDMTVFRSYLEEGDRVENHHVYFWVVSPLSKEVNEIIEYEKKQK